MIYFKYVLLIIPWLATSATAQTPVDPNWTRIVPGDAHFYAEFRNLADVRELFRKLNIWDLVREIGERGRHGATSRPWSERTQQLLGMDTDDAITRLLSRRAALIAATASQWQNGVILGELEDNSQLTKLLEQWDAKSPYEEGEVKCYTLRGGLKLAVQDRVIALGPSGDPDGMWGRTVLLLAGKRGPQLGARAEFASLKSRMSREYQGLVYSWWDEDDPHSIAGCRRLLAAFDVTPTGITAELHGQRHRPMPEQPYAGHPIAQLPASTIMAFAGSTDFSRLFGKRFDEGQIDTRSIIELFLGFFAHGEDTPLNLLTQLGPNYTLVLSSEDFGETRLPVLTAICDSSKPAEHMRQLDVVVGFFALLLASYEQPAATSAPAHNVQTIVCEGIELHHVPLGVTLARRMGLEIFKPVDCCWGVVDNRLVLSSSRRFAEELVRSSRGKSPGLEAALATKEKDKPAEVLMIRGTDAAAMIESWLAYIRSKHPEAVAPEWWQTWAQTQFAKNTSLGLSVQADAQGRAVVLEIQPYSPAKELLKPGDLITAVGSRILDPKFPALDIAQRYQARGKAHEFVVKLLRDEQKLTVKIPVTPADALDISTFDPIRDLQRLQTLLARVRLLNLTRNATRPDRLDASLSVEWRAQP